MMRQSIPLLLAYCLCLTTLTSHAQVLVRQMQGVSEYRLTNGLQVLLAPNELHTRTYANLTVKVGAMHEGAGEGGMAHLLEHLVFLGTPTRPGDIKGEFNKKSFSANGTTNQDRTDYFASMNPSQDNLNWYLSWLADASSNSLISQTSLDKEMSVVRNEFERRGNNVGQAMHESKMALTFPNHGYGRPVIGNQSDIESVSITKLQSFYKTWYRPDNMVLVVSGRFDTQKTLAHIQAVFGVLTNPTYVLTKPYTREPVQEGPRGATLRRMGGEPMTMISYRGVPNAHPDKVALDVVAHTLANNATSRLRIAMNPQNVGSAVSTNHNAMAYYGQLTVFVQTTNASNFNTIQTIVQKQIDEIANKGVTGDELNRAQTFYKSAFLESKNTATTFGSAIANFASLGDWRLGFWHNDNIAKVTIADTQRVAKAYLIEANRVRVSYIPDAQPERAHDAKPVGLGEYQALALQQTSASVDLEPFAPTALELDKRTVRSQLAVGTQIALLPRPTAGDAINGVLRIYWGNHDVMRGKGAAPLMGALLTRRTLTLSGKELEDRFNQLQSGLSVKTSVHGLTLTFKTTRQNWPAFSELLHEILNNPKFREPEFQTWKKQTIATLSQQRDEPASKTRIAMVRAMYAYDPQDPRYEFSAQELIDHLNALTLDQVQQFWTQFSGASVSEFAAVGALDVGRVQSDLASILNGWYTIGGAQAYTRIAAPYQPANAQRLTLPTPGKSNASYDLGWPLTGDPDTRDGMALGWANLIIGGGSSSRLFSKLRSTEGLTYGVQSTLSGNATDKTALFRITGTYAPKNREKFEATVNETLEEIKKNGITEAELIAVKHAALEGTKSSRNNNASVANALAENERRIRDGTPSSYARYDALNSEAQSITIDEVNAAVRKLIELNKSIVIITGDFK